jgi:hypothetical protein
VHNADSEERETALRLGRERLVDLLDVEDVPPPHRLRLEPYGYRWFRLGR